MDVNELLRQNEFGYPAGVRAIGDVGAGDDTLRARLEAVVLDADVLREHAPFFWRASVSNHQVDSYYTSMRASSLKNYAADADEGRPFMNSHRTGGLFRGAELPMGKSLTGTFNDGSDGTEPRVDADFYTLRGIKLGEVETDDLISGIRSGIVASVSIGFQPGRFMCNICDRDMLKDMNCEHIPGFEYQVERESADGTKRTDTVMAIAGVEDARLAEVSGVYQGATPGAAVIKAWRMAEEGKLGPERASLVQMRYRVAIPGTQRAWAIPAPTTTQEERMTPPKAGENQNAGGGTPAAPAPTQVQGDPQQPGQLTEAVRQELIKAGFNPPAEDPAAMGRAINDLIARDAASTTEISRLKPLAADGERYRVALVADVKAEMARAIGSGFNAEAYAFLDTLPIDALERMRDDNKKLGDARFSPGRKTADGGETGAETFTIGVPDEAHRA